MRKTIFAWMLCGAMCCCDGGGAMGADLGGVAEQCCDSERCEPQGVRLDVGTIDEITKREDVFATTTPLPLTGGTFGAPLQRLEQGTFGKASVVTLINVHVPLYVEKQFEAGNSRSPKSYLLEWLSPYEILHRNVLGVVDVRVSNLSKVSLFTPFCNGSLGTALNAGILTPGDHLTIMIEMLRGVYALHKSGMYTVI